MRTFCCSRLVWWCDQSVWHC